MQRASCHCGINIHNGQRTVIQYNLYTFVEGSRRFLTREIYQIKKSFQNQLNLNYVLLYCKHRFYEHQFIHDLLNLKYKLKHC